MNESLPTPVLEFDPVAFDEATAMFNDEEKYKYIRCLRFYWYHTHCDGIVDDDMGMFELCHCKPENWMRLKGMIFDNDKFFYLEGGKWHQKRARKQYADKQNKLLKKQNQTADALWARGIVPSNVTLQTGSNVASDVSPNVAAIMNERALRRVETRIETLRGQRPFPKGDKRIAELDEMKSERRRLMDLLGLKA